MTRKLPILAALSALLFFASLLAEHVAFARYVGGNTTTTVTQPDQWCVGGTNQGTGNTATEVCVDYGGNFIPTTTNVQKLGSSSLQFNDVEAANINSGGGNLVLGTSASVVTLAGTENLGKIGVANAAGTGNSAGPADLSIAGQINYQPAQIGAVSGGAVGQGIYISTTLPVISSYELLLSSGGNILMTATPAISTLTVAGSATGQNLVADGTVLVITSTDTAVITLQSNGALSGSLIKLGASTRAITQFKVLTLVFQQKVGMWLEQSYSADTN